MREEVVHRALASVTAHDEGERPLVPLGVRQPNDHRLEYRWVGHERVLEGDGADPLAAGLDDILGAIANRDPAVGIDRGDVSGPEPAVLREAVARLRRIVIVAQHPRAADLELAHRL